LDRSAKLFRKSRKAFITMTVAFFDEPLQLSKRPLYLRSLDYKPLERKVISLYDACQLPVGDEVMCDVECFSNYFLVGFKHVASNSYFIWNYSNTCLILQAIMQRFLIVTFNGNSYDLPIIRKAIKGGTVQELKELSDAIIKQDFRADDRAALGFNHIDLMEVAPLSNAAGFRTSLKTYGARLHSPRIQEMPIDPNEPLPTDQWGNIDLKLIWIIIEYNFNDLDCTQLLREELKPNIKLREAISKKYGADFRSLSDAQIAEKIASFEIKKLTGSYPQKPGAGSFDGQTFFYLPPKYIKFQTSELQTILSRICAMEITIATGYARCQELKELTFSINNKTYKIGLGGLHSQEKTISVRSTETIKVLDRDVTGYYPNMIIKNKFFSRHLGDVEGVFLQSVVTERTAAKKSGDDVTASCLKITSNGWFGKKSDQFSIAYDPTEMVQTTLTGQLSLLMLIEQLTLRNFEIVSANTDGVVTLCPTERYKEFCTMLTAWEQLTGLDTEETQYSSYHARDVNNYFAIKLDGEVKAKGAYTERGSALNSVLSKNPFNLIVLDAVKAKLSKGTAIEETIFGCKDVRRFVCVQNVRGGAHKEGVYLGRVVRWYYAQGEAGAIHYVTSGNQVPRSTGARPLMELPADNELPADLALNYYVNEAYSILRDIGFSGKKQIDFFG
jgi:hypothetical protein